MRADFLRTSQSVTGAAWYALVMLLGAFAYISLTVVSIEALILASGAVFFALYLLDRSAYWVVFLAVAASILITNANYTVLTYAADGTEIARGTGSELLAMMRLPIAMCCIALVLARHGVEFGRFSAKNWDVVLFAILPFFSAFFSVNTGRAFEYALWFSCSIGATLAFFFLLGTYLPRGRWVEHLGWLLLAASLPVVGMALMALPSYQPGGKLVGAYSDTNFYAYACSVVLASLLVLERRRGSGSASRLLKRIPFAALGALGLLAAVPLFLSAKRAPILAAVAVLLLYLVGRKSTTNTKRSLGWWRSVSLLGAFLLTAWAVFPHADTTVKRFEKAFDPEKNTSIQQRQAILETSLETIVVENPVFGVGLSNGYATLGSGLHNTVLAVLVELGAVGLVVFMIMVARSALQFRGPTFSTFRWDVLLLAVPPALLSLTEYNLLPGQAMFWPLWLTILIPRIGLLRGLPSSGDGGQGQLERLAAKPKNLI